MMEIKLQLFGGRGSGGGNNPGSSNKNSNFVLGQSVLLDVGNATVSDMTIIDISKEGQYHLRPTNLVRPSAFDNPRDRYEDMYVDKSYLEKYRLRNTGK